MIVAPPKAGYRGIEVQSSALHARERPHRTEHEQSAMRARHPQSVSDHICELQDAREAETVTRLHASGVEWEPADGTGHGGGGSALGTRRWTVDFRSYITGNDCDTTVDGEWKWPLRSSLFRLSVSRSGTDRLAAAFVYLLIRNRLHVRKAWAQQCGILADPAIADAAEAWAGEALRRWFGYYIAQPLGKPLA